MGSLLSKVLKTDSTSRHPSSDSASHLPTPDSASHPPASETSIDLPPPRPWICFTEAAPHSYTFKVMCYNILCDYYANPAIFNYCPKWALNWEYRKKLILQEILHHKADIVCLQEVETGQFHDFFRPELRREDYDGIFAPKNRCKKMSRTYRNRVDGCCIFYKTDKFRLVKKHVVEFNQLAKDHIEDSEEILDRVTTKDNIAVSALLKLVANKGGPDSTQVNQTLLVCSPHLHWDPEFCDVKVVQAMILMHEMKKFVAANVAPTLKGDSSAIPFLMCGDFNSLPNSGVFEYLSSGRVSTGHSDFKNFPYKDCFQIRGKSKEKDLFTHPFQLSSAYKDDIMPFTNYTFRFKGVIDYVFHSKPHMSVLKVLGPIDENWLKENHIYGCPHSHVPSDHFPLLVELQLNSAVSV